jgi:hypothetical protein
MNNISTWRVVCTFRRALWFSFVTAPALSFLSALFFSPLITLLRGVYGGSP